MYYFDSQNVLQDVNVIIIFNFFLGIWIFFVFYFLFLDLTIKDVPRWGLYIAGLDYYDVQVGSIFIISLLI